MNERRGFLTRRTMLAATLAAASTPGAGYAQEHFPSKPITLIVPWPAGGATDVTLRLLAELAGQRLGQRIVIYNRPGAGGTMAMPMLQHALPDGYTLAQLPFPVLRVPYLQKVDWDPIRDTTPIIQISGVTFGVLVPAASPFKSFDDLLKFAAAHPGELTISTNGLGTTPHVVMDEVFGRRNLRYIHVPYKGTSEQMVALASGQLMVGVNSNGFAPYVDAGQLRLLVTFSDTRTRRWPDVPTLKELGFGIVATSPYGLVGPAGMNPQVLAALHSAFKAALFDPVHLQELAKFDQEPAYLPPEAYAAALREAYAAERRSVERQGLGRAS
ncbi:tripartite tricarboxylate transporter substrate binding protein [Ottowia sp. VDI28]|uniref:tripartite tricarboxylate transporter substrate binding protein n=1 Tax=Ottowia sp. VDI28 TaxID=3133968 RepID=UPI003C2F0567